MKRAAPSRGLVRVGLALVVTALTASCYGPDPNVTRSGRGLPEVSVAFTEVASPGETEEAIFEIVNPGPGEMSSVVIAFSRVGNDKPIVDGGVGGRNEAVASVSPQPRSVSAAGVEYVFGPLDEGETLSVTFGLRMPQDRGVVANSVVVYDGSETDRVRGIRLETSVQ